MHSASIQNAAFCKHSASVGSAVEGAAVQVRIGGGRARASLAEDSKLCALCYFPVPFNLEHLSNLFDVLL